jgi:hypothetical protein
MWNFDPLRKRLKTNKLIRIPFFKQDGILYCLNLADSQGTMVVVVAFFCPHLQPNNHSKAKEPNFLALFD